MTKPTKLKIAKGTARTSRMKDEPMPDDDEIVPPEWLSKEGSKVWEKELPRLRVMGILGNPDINMFAMYCEYFAQWKDAMKKLNKEGMTIKVKKTKKSGINNTLTKSEEWVLNPLYHTVNKRFDQCMKIMAKFGMSPLDRVGLKSSGKPQKPQKPGFLDLD